MKRLCLALLLTLIVGITGTPLGQAHSIADLDAQFSGASDILETWFTSYESGNTSKGFAGPDAAREMARRGVEAFEGGE